MQWAHFVPGYDHWFNESFTKQWGEKNNVSVTIDNVGLGDLGKRANAEVSARSGHDLIGFVAPPAVHEDDVIDHREIYQECQKRYGKVVDFALRSTYNPKTDKYFGVCHAYAPALVNYRKDLWDGISGGPPDSWSTILAGGRRIKLLHEKPVGISLAAEHNGEHTLRAILSSFGASEQDANGRPALKSAATLEAIRYVKSLFEEAMPKEVLTWNAASNNHFMLNGDGSLTVDTISIPRAYENMAARTAGDLRLTSIPLGSAGRRGPAFGYYTSVIWKFAENIDTAKQFLLDYMSALRDAFRASGFQNMPTIMSALPDLRAVLEADPGGGIPGKYAVLADSESWTSNLGDPGYTNGAVIEVLDRGTISRMFARAATGEFTPEKALIDADAEVNAIFKKWHDRGKI